MPWRDDPGGRAPAILLGVALLAAAALMLVLTWGTTFFQDTWAFLLDRRGDSAHAFLAPHNEHIVVIPVAIEKLLVSTFGLGSKLPEQFVLTSMLCAVAALVFVYVRRRMGPWPGLIAALLLLFVGSAWEVLLWPFEISLVGSVLAGVAMLLVLEREDRRGDIAACVLLTLSVGCSSLGVAFIVGAAVDVLQRRRSRGLGRAYVAAIPFALYAAWYLGYGHEAQSAASLHNAIHAPIFLVEGIAVSTGSLLGVSWLAEELPGDPRRYLAVVAVLAAAALLSYLRLRKPATLESLHSWGSSSRLWPTTAAAAAFWLLAGLNKLPGREANASRYLYIGGVFVLLIAADLLRKARFGRPTLIAAGAIALVAVGSNMVPLLEGADILDEQTVLTRADLGAVEIARRTVPPDFWLHPELAGTPSLINVTAGPYLEISDEFGSPAYTPAELAGAPEAGRRQADIVLAEALPVSVETAPGAARRQVFPAGACVRVPAGAASGRAGLPLSPGEAVIEVPPGGPVRLRLRRFAVGEYPVGLGPVPAGSATTLRIPRDRAERRWRLQIRSPGGALVCRSLGLKPVR
jgi:hypothetical protein